MADVDWRAVFAKYLAIVVRQEGVHFLEYGQGDEEDDFTAEEWAAILVLYDEQFVPKGWRVFDD